VLVPASMGNAYCGRKSLRKVETNSPFQKALGTDLVHDVSEAVSKRLNNKWFPPST